MSQCARPSCACLLSVWCWKETLQNGTCILNPGACRAVNAASSDFMDTDVLDAHLDSVSRSEACDVNHFDSAFTNAFLKTDEEFGKVSMGSVPAHAFASVYFVSSVPPSSCCIP